jgi:transcriptional regulator with XRE-family HTH domain
MNEQPSKKNPYFSLGNQLQNIREKSKQTIDQVSGAIEVDSELLVKFENGLKLPDEDILSLLISHFNLQSDEAKKIWRLAGYDSFVDNFSFEPPVTPVQVPTIVIVPFDNKVIYSDLVQLSTNNYGLVLNFMQASTQKNNQPQFVSRIGISREHAADIVKMLSQALKTNLLEPDKKSENQTDNKQN